MTGPSHEVAIPTRPRGRAALATRPANGPHHRARRDPGGNEARLFNGPFVIAPLLTSISIFTVVGLAQMVVLSIGHMNLAVGRLAGIGALSVLAASAASRRPHNPDRGWQRLGAKPPPRAPHRGAGANRSAVRLCCAVRCASCRRNHERLAANIHAETLLSKAFHPIPMLLAAGPLIRAWTRLPLSRVSMQVYP